MAKQVKIVGMQKVFPTQRAALEHFEQIKQRSKLKELLVGDDAADIKAAYEHYCIVTNWPLPTGITGFSVDNKQEEISNP